MKKLIAAILLASCFVFGCTGCKNEYSSTAGYRQVGAAEAMEIMNTEENYIILDVRTWEEYKSGHIAGAVCIPNETIGTEAPTELSDKNQMILVYCRSGNRSKQAARKLAAMGYTNIVEFGGINSWHGEIVSGEE